MKHSNGEVVLVKDIVFKDNNSLDPKGKRPTLLILTTMPDGTVYFLTLTSQVDKYFNMPWLKSKYSYLYSTSKNGLARPSLVNLQNIYSKKDISDYHVAKLQPYELKKVIVEFKACQNRKPDPDYAIIKGYL